MRRVQTTRNYFFLRRSRIRSFPASVISPIAPNKVTRRVAKADSTRTAQSANVDGSPEKPSTSGPWNSTRSGGFTFFKGTVGPPCRPAVRSEFGPSPGPLATREGEIASEYIKVLLSVKRFSEVEWWVVPTLRDFDGVGMRGLVGEACLAPTGGGVSRISGSGVVGGAHPTSSYGEREAGGTIVATVGR